MSSPSSRRPVGLPPVQQFFIDPLRDEGGNVIRPPLSPRTPSPQPLGQEWDAILSAPIPVAYPVGEAQPEIDNQCLLRVVPGLKDQQGPLHQVLTDISEGKYEFSSEDNGKTIEGKFVGAGNGPQVRLTHDMQGKIRKIDVLDSIGDLTSDLRLKLGHYKVERPPRQISRLSLDLYPSSQFGDRLSKQLHAQYLEEQWNILERKAREAFSGEGKETNTTEKQKSVVADLVRWCKAKTGNAAAISLEMIHDRLLKCEVDNPPGLDTLKEILRGKNIDLPLMSKEAEQCFGIEDEIAKGLMHELKLPPFEGEELKEFQQKIRDAITFAQEKQKSANKNTAENAKRAFIAIYHFIKEKHSSLNITLFGDKLKPVFQNFGVSGVPAREILRRAVGGGRWARQNADELDALQKERVNTCREKCQFVRSEMHSKKTDDSSWTTEAIAAIDDLLAVLPPQTFQQFSDFLQTQNILSFKSERKLETLVKNGDLKTDKLSAPLQAKDGKAAHFSDEEVKEKADKFAELVCINCNAPSWDEAKEKQYLGLIRNMAEQASIERSKASLPQELKDASRALHDFCMKENSFLTLEWFARKQRDVFGQYAPSKTALRYQIKGRVVSN